VEARGNPRLRRRAWIAPLALLAATLGPTACRGDPVTYSRRAVAGVSLHVIDVDLNDARVRVAPALAARGPGSAESLRSFVHRLRPTAAVNGTYFDKRTLRPVGDIVVGGKVLNFGGMGTAIAFTHDGVDFIRLPKSRRVDWSDHRAALAAGPLLVWDGFAKPRPGGEGFGDPAVFARAAPRTAVAVTKANHLLLVTTIRGASLGQLAGALRALGAQYAVNLDGGASAGMWCAGRMIRSPGRALTNVLCVYVTAGPAGDDPPRPPRGLDWRGGHPPRKSLRLSGHGLEVSAKLPRFWAGRESVALHSNRPLPEGYVVSVSLDEHVVAVAAVTPAELPVDLTGLPAGKHVLSLHLLDGDKKVVASVRRIFRPEVWPAAPVG